MSKFDHGRMCNICISNLRNVCSQDRSIVSSLYTGILYVYTYQTYTTVIEEIQRYVSSIDYFQTISAIIYQPERRIRGKEEK